MAENKATSERPERGRLARLMIDTRPLRRREFRLLWLGELVSETGSNIAVVALYVQVYRITGSALAVGGIGLVQFVPILLSALFGAPLVDRHDRRRNRQGRADQEGPVVADLREDGAGDDRTKDPCDRA